MHTGGHGTDDSTTLLKGAGLGAGLALLGVFGCKFLMQAPTLLAGHWNEGLALEHKAALLLFDKLEETDNNDKVKRRLLLGKLKQALTKHALQEENVIYPALRDAGMAEDADALNHDHGYVKQYLYDLHNAIDDSLVFQRTLAEFRTDIEKHMTEEEENLFPRLKSLLDAESDKALTRMVNMEGLKQA